MDYKKEVQVKRDDFKNGYPIDLSISITGYDGMPDCQIGHFGYNFYYRTPYGIKRKSYKNNKTMEKAVEKILHNKGWTVLKWTIAL